MRLRRESLKDLAEAQRADAADVAPEADRHEE
jgi:hypothetical protein